MECAEVLLQMLHCTVLRCAYGANLGELMVNPFNICIPLPQLDLIYNIDHVSFLFNRGWVNHKLHNNRVEGKVKWITRSEYDVLPTTRSNDCFKQLCQNRKMDVLEILPRWTKDALHRFVSRSSEVQTWTDLALTQIFPDFASAA